MDWKLIILGSDNMANNVGYLTASNNDELYTPYYAVDPIIEYVPKGKVIWCPFDKEWSMFVRLLRENGNLVICSHIDNGYDFFNYEPYYYDMIISNPPFSVKDDVIKRLYELKVLHKIIRPNSGLFFTDEQISYITRELLIENK